MPSCFALTKKGETTNLWHQGKIPEHYRGRLPDNAKWGK